MMVVLLQHPQIDEYDLSTLTKIGYGAAAMPVEVLKSAIDRFGPVVWSGFGMTELGGNVLTHPISAHVRAVNGEEHLLAACGVPMTFAAAQVVDDDMRELAARRDRRDHHQGRAAAAGLLEPARGHRGGVPRRLVPHRATWPTGTPRASSTSSTARRT